MTTDVHNLGNFASLAAAWERYPNGAMVGDYIFIAGVRYDWDKYEKQWLTPVAVTDMNISVFDVSTYDFEANDWRHALPNGEYTVVSNTQAVGKLLKYDDGFVLEGFVTLTEAGADKVFSPVVDGGKPKADAKILSGNQSCHKYVYVDSKGVYNVSDATERGQIGDIQHYLDDIQHHLDDLQQYVDDNLHSLDKKVKPLADSIGTAEDVAAADGTLYARIKKNADDIAENKENVKVLIERVDTVTGTANEAKALTKVNEERLNSVQATANTALENSERNQDSVRNAQVTANEAKASVEGLTTVVRRAENNISQLKELNVVYPNNIRSLTTESTVAEVMEAFVPAIGGSAGKVNTPHVGYLIKGATHRDSPEDTWKSDPDSTIISVEVVKIDNNDCHKFMYIDNNRDLVTMTVCIWGGTFKVIERSVVSNINTIVDNINTFDDFYTRMTDYIIGDNDDTALINIETLQHDSITLKYKTLDTVNGSKATRTKTIPAVDPMNGGAGAAGMNLVHDIPYFFDFYKSGFTSLWEGSDITKILIPKFQTNYNLFDDLYTDVPAIQNKVFAYPKAGDRIRMGMPSLLGTPGVFIQMWATVTSAQFISNVYSVTVDYDGDTYIFAFVVSNDTATLKVPWSKISSKRNIYSADISSLTSDLSEADIKGLLTPLAYQKYNIIYPVKPQTGDLMEEVTDDGESRFITITALRNQENPDEYTDIIIPFTGKDNRVYKIVLKNDLSSVQSYKRTILENYRRRYDGKLLLALDTVKAETIENSISEAYSYSIEQTGNVLEARLPKVGDLITINNTDVPICEVFLDSDDVQHTRWFYKGKLYDVAVITALTRVPEDPKVIYDTTSGTLRDLYVSAGAVYNEATGYYELNGLTDITEEQMRVIWQEDLSGWYLKGRTNLTRNIEVRCNAGGYNGGIDITNICHNNSNITKFNFGTSPFARYLDNAFSGCTKLETIDTRFPIAPFGRVVVGPNIFRKCTSLKEVRFNMRHLEMSTNVNFPASSLISKASILSIIETTPTTGSVKPLVVVGLNESAYNRLKDDTDIQQALTEKNGFVTLTQI